MIGSDQKDKSERKEKGEGVYSVRLLRPPESSGPIPMQRVCSDCPQPPTQRLTFCLSSTCRISPTSPTTTACCRNISCSTVNQSRICNRQRRQKLEKKEVASAGTKYYCEIPEEYDESKPDEINNCYPGIRGVMCCFLQITMTFSRSTTILVPLFLVSGSG